MRCWKCWKLNCMRKWDYRCKNGRWYWNGLVCDWCGKRWTLTEYYSLQIATFGLVAAGVILLAITLIIGGKQTTQSRPTKSPKEAAVLLKAGIVSVGNKTPQETTKANYSEKPNSSYHFRGVTKMVVKATAYTDRDAGCNTVTATGRRTRTSRGRHIPGIAVDPRVIPLGSVVDIPGYGLFIADDTGGAIKGRKIDIRMNTKRECFAFGRRTIEIKVRMKK